MSSRSPRANSSAPPSNRRPCSTICLRQPSSAAYTITFGLVVINRSAAGSALSLLVGYALAWHPSRRSARVSQLSLDALQRGRIKASFGLTARLERGHRADIDSRCRAPGVQGSRCPGCRSPDGRGCRLPEGSRPTASGQRGHPALGQGSLLEPQDPKARRDGNAGDGYG